MPYGIINRDYYGAKQRGREDALNEQTMRTRNALGGLDLEMAQRFNALANNPQATPEQYARLGRSDVANYFAGRENSAAERQQIDAKRLFTAAQYGVKAASPKEFIARNFPDIAAMNPTFATDTDEQIRASLQELIARQGAMLGEGPPDAKGVGALYKYLDDNGNPIYGDASSAMGKTPFEKPSRGISMTMPDGTEVQIGGDGVPQYGGVGLTKPNQTKMQEAFINAQGNAYALREQLSKYNPEFSTLGGRFKAGVANLKEQIGMENAPQQTQFLADFTSWKSDTNNLLSQYLNQLSGAAISPHEEVRLRNGFPNDKDGPTQYLAKAKTTMRNFSLVQARTAYLLSNPSQSLDSVSLESMSNIISAEANKLAKSYERGGMDPEAARARAIQETRTRFGMGQ